MKIQHLFLSMCLCYGTVLSAQNNSKGGITPAMLQEISKTYQGTPNDKAIRNAITNNSINKLAVNLDNKTAMNTYFSHKVENKGITDQKSSGRCWLFTGLNVLRAKMIARYNLPSFQFSQNYCFFWDQLEKSNLFLQGVIDTREKPIDDQTVTWLFQHPIGDGGQFTGVSDLIEKYGVVPSEVMPETNSSNQTATMSKLIALKLREFGLELRELPKNTKAENIEKKKTEMLGTIYRMLVLNLGEPPTTFQWTRKDKSGNPVETKEYTPLSFFKEYINEDLTNNYIMVMNDPSREFNKVYEIDYDRHVYDGHNWKYLNLPIEDIKAMAIASIKDSTMLYFSCDVGKFMDSERGLLDIHNFDYESLFGTTFGMDKKQRIQTFASGSSHAMTLMAVDLDENQKPIKWMVENSWGAASGYQGHLIMTDEWFNEYMFRLVVEKKYVPEAVLKLMEQKAEKLPAWDPMFAPEN